jgi:hypothetical protein
VTHARARATERKRKEDMPAPEKKEKAPRVLARR